jgi:hypothetical protein
VEVRVVEPALLHMVAAVHYLRLLEVVIHLVTMVQFVLYGVLVVHSHQQTPQINKKE